MFITAELDVRVSPLRSKLLASGNVYCHHTLAVLTVPIKLSLTISAHCFSGFPWCSHERGAGGKRLDADSSHQMTGTSPFVKKAGLLWGGKYSTGYWEDGV